MWYQKSNERKKLFVLIIRKVFYSHMHVAKMCYDALGRVTPITSSRKEYRYRTLYLFLFLHGFWDSYISLFFGI